MTIPSLSLSLALALAAPAPDDPAAAVEALKGEFDAAQSAFWETYQSTPEEEREALFETDFPEPSEWAPRFFALAERHEGTAAACDALAWIAQQVQAGEPKRRALDLLITHHADSERLAAVCRTLRRDTTAQAERFLRTLLEESPHDDVRGNAAYALAHALRQTAEFAGRVDDQDDDAKGLREWLGEETVERLRGLDAGALTDEAKELLRLVAAEYADVGAGRGTLGEDAEGDLFELEHLAIGCVAPEIEGEDVDGVHFALSDHRGRVVVLDFWGDW